MFERMFGRSRSSGLASGIGAAALLLVASGCVSQQKYDRLVSEYSTENQARRQLEDEIQRRDGEMSDLRGAVAEKDQKVTELTALSSEDKARIEQLKQALADATKSFGDTPEGVEVFREANGFAYRIADQLLFDSGSTDIRDAGKKALLQIAKEIVEKGYKDVRIDGHTDADPVIHTRVKFPLGNYELSAERALAVFGVLTHDGKVAENVFTIAAFGPSRPLKSGETDAVKSKNRRVEIHVAVPKKS